MKKIEKNLINTTNVTQKIVTLRNKLVDMFVGREEEVTAVLAGLFSGEPTILVGPPGTAKTALIEAVSRAVGGKYFYYLLTRFTEPDELLGPLDIKALREGQYRRITAGRLPEAEIVFLDEVFKASSAVRNILLDIILNKRYLNGNGYVKLPMLTLYTASNEVSTDEEDAAFYDRLLIRRFVRYVSSDMWRRLIEAGISLEVGDGVKQVLTPEDVRAVQRVVHRRMSAINDAVISKYLNALMMLREKGVEVSDRRKVKILKVAAAISVIYMEKEVTPDDVADALRFCAPFDPDDVKKVEEVIEESRMSSLSEVIMKWMMLSNELNNALKALREEQTLQNFQTAVKVYKRLRAELLRAPKTPRLLTYVRQIKTQMEGARAELEEIRKKLTSLEI